MDEVETVADRGAVEEPAPRPRRERLHLSIRIFSSASDAPRARRPTDAVLVVLSIFGVLLCLVPAPSLTKLDKGITGFLQSLPGLFGGAWEVAYDLLRLWPLVLLAITLLTHRRKRVFRDMLLALIIGLVYAGLAAGLIGTDAKTALSQSLGGGASSYLGFLLAMATALIATASPHLTQPLRRLGRWVIFLGALAAVALGLAAPIGTLAGFLIGISGAATVHLLFGSPGGRLTLEEVGQALEDLGVEATNLRDAPLEPRGVAIVEGEMSDGRPIRIRIFGRDAQQGQLIASTWSSLRRRGATPDFGWAQQQVLNEGFASLFAQRGGVPVVPIIAAGMAAEGDGLLVLEAGARDLASLEPDEIDDDVIDQFWRAFARLEELGIALSRVDRRVLSVRADGTAAIGSFADAMLAAYDPAVLSDQAQLLVTTALAVGQERAVAAVVRTTGKEATEAFLPYVQSAALAPETLREVKAGEWHLDDLRVRAEQQTGSAPAELEQLRRVTWGSLLKLALIGLVAYAILSAVLDIGIQTLIEEFQNANAWWLLGALAMTPVAQLPQAFSTLGATLKELRYFPVLMLQFGIQFIALAVPSSAARVALEIRFFERVGIPATGAVTIGMIDSFSTFVIQILVIIIITVSGLASLDLFGSESSSSSSSSGSSSSSDWEIAAVILGLLILGLLAAVLVPRFRHMLRRFLRGLREKTEDGREALQVLRHPKKLLFLLGGNFVAQVFLAIILGMCLQAFGYGATMAQLLLINTIVSLFAGFMPVPGGVGVAEAAYTTCLVAIGIPTVAATSIAIAYRVVTFYVPPAWGGWAMHWMKENRYL